MTFGETFFSPGPSSNFPVWFQHVFWVLGQWEIYPILISGLVLIGLLVVFSLRLGRNGKWGWLIALWGSVVAFGALYWIGYQDIRQQYLAGVGRDGLTWRLPALLTIWPMRLLSWVLPFMLVGWLLAKPARHRFKDFATRLYAFGGLMLLIGLILTAQLLYKASASPGFHDSYYVVAHFKYGFGFLLILLFFGLGFWIMRRSYSRWLALVQFATTMTGITLSVFPQYFVSSRGMPRRYVDYVESHDNWALVSQLGYLLLLVGAVLFIIAMTHAAWGRFRR